MKPEVLQNILNDSFPNSKVTTYDYTGGGDHWKVTIISDLFKNKSLVERHQMVYKALGDHMKSEIHALSLDTLVPGEE